MTARTGALGEHAREEGLDIGFVSMGFPPDVGGIETHLGALARELSGRGHRVHVLCLDTRADRAPYTSADDVVEGVRVRRVAYRWHDHRSLADFSARAAANDVVMAWLAEEPCDVVHVHHASGFGAGLLQAVSDMGRPLCVTLHDYWFLCPRGQMFRRDGVVCERAEPVACGVCLAATWPQLLPSGRGDVLAADAAAAATRTAHALEMLALPARLFAPSKAAREVFERAGVPAQRIDVVENGIDASELARDVAALRATSGESSSVVRIGVLGSAQPSKGVLEFARAALALEERELVVEIHGALADYHGDQATVEALRELAARDARLVLRGAFAHADLAAVLARLDAVAVPSLWNETFGLTAREARAAGLRVLASDRGGLRELRDDPGVRLLPSHDPRAWTDAVAALLGERRVALERGEKPMPARLRTVHELALELETHYVDLVRTQLGREPALVFEAGTDRRAQRTAAPAPSWWRRLRGG
ncbi:MAG TPA: glycosyltransferase [Planctomycetota bacterium]|nr:glycosyltransferase [Planctomycetota bacterium]